MSDFSQGPGWWYASDGRWYPPAPPTPESPPPAASLFPPPSGPGVGPIMAPPSPPSPGSKKSRRAATVLGICVVVFVLLVIGGIIALTRSGTDNHVNAASSPTVTSGTGADLSASTTGPPAAGFTTFRDTTNNFSIGTPVTWQQMSLADSHAQAAIDKLVAENPHLAASLGSVSSLATSGIKFLAVDPTGGATVNVIVQSSPGAPADVTDSDLEDGVPDLSKGLETTGATITSHQIVTVNGRKAIKILYVLPLTNGGVDLKVHGAAYVFVTKDTLHIVTIAGTDDVVEQVISTFTIG